MKMPWRRWDVSKWRNSPEALRMSLAAQGAHHNLLDAAWEMDGKLPNQPDILWRYALAKNPADFDAVAAEVLPLWNQSEDGLFLLNGSLTEEREDAEAHMQHVSQVRSEAGRKGNAKRWKGHTPAHPRRNSSEDAEAGESRKITNGSQALAQDVTKQNRTRRGATAVPPFLQIAREKLSKHIRQHGPNRMDIEHSSSAKERERHQQQYDRELFRCIMDGRGGMTPSEVKEFLGEDPEWRKWKYWELLDSPDTVVFPEPQKQAQAPKRQWEGAINAEFIWNDLLKSLKAKVPQHSWETWLKPTRGVGLEGDTLFVEVPTVEFMHIGDKYGTLITDLLPVAVPTVKFIVEGQQEPASDSWTYPASQSYPVDEHGGHFEGDVYVTKNGKRMPGYIPPPSKQASNKPERREEAKTEALVQSGSPSQIPSTVPMIKSCEPSNANEARDEEYADPVARLSDWDLEQIIRQLEP